MSIRRSTASSLGWSSQPRWPSRSAVRRVSIRAWSAGANASTPVTTGPTTAVHGAAALPRCLRAIRTANRAACCAGWRSITQDRVEGRVQSGQARPVTPRKHDDPPAPADDLGQRQSGPGALAGGEDPEARAESADGVIERLVRALGGDRDEPERAVGIEASRERVAPHPPGAGSVEGDGPEQLLEERATRLDIPGDELAVDRAVARSDGGHDDVAGVQQPTRKVQDHRPIPWLLLTELPHRPERGQVAIEQSLGQQPGMRARLTVGAQAGHRGVEVSSLGQQVRDELDRRADRRRPARQHPRPRWRPWRPRRGASPPRGRDRAARSERSSGHDPSSGGLGCTFRTPALLPHGSRSQWRLPG